MIKIKDVKQSYQKIVFCRGVLCNKFDRKHRCYECGIYICNLCSFQAITNKKYYCPRCYFSTYSPDWDKMNKEFEEMILKLGLKKNDNTIIQTKKEEETNKNIL